MTYLIYFHSLSLSSGAGSDTLSIRPQILLCCKGNFRPGRQNAAAMVCRHNFAGCRALQACSLSSSLQNWRCSLHQVKKVFCCAPLLRASYLSHMLVMAAPFRAREPARKDTICRTFCWFAHQKGCSKRHKYDNSGYSSTLFRCCTLTWCWAGPCAGSSRRAPPSHSRRAHSSAAHHIRAAL